MKSTERIQMIEHWMRDEYNRDDIHVVKADPRCGSKYCIVIKDEVGVAAHISNYLSLSELEAYAKGLLDAKFNELTIKHLTKQ